MDTSPATIDTLSDDVQLRILGMCTLEERCASAAGVCRRWRQLCNSAELLAHVDICTWGCRARQQPASLCAIFGWLHRRAAQHAKTVCLRLGSSTPRDADIEATLWQVAEQVLPQLGAATELHVELVGLSLELFEGAAQLGALRRLHIEQPCGDMQLETSLAQLTALQELCISGCPLSLAAEQYASLPGSLTGLKLEVLRCQRLPTQLSTLSNLQSLAVRMQPSTSVREPDFYDVLKHLASLTSLSLGDNGLAVLPQCTASLTRLQQLAVNGRAVDVQAVYGRQPCVVALHTISGSDSGGEEAAMARTASGRWPAPFEALAPAVGELEELFADPDWDLDSSISVQPRGPVARRPGETLLEMASRAKPVPDPRRELRIAHIHSPRGFLSFGGTAFEKLMPDYVEFQERSDLDTFRESLDEQLTQLADAVTMAATAAQAAIVRPLPGFGVSCWRSITLTLSLLPTKPPLAFKRGLPAMGSHATSLALALSGFTVDAVSEGSGAVEGSEAPLARPPAAAATADRPVAAGAAALVQHASLIATRVLERWKVPGYSPEQDGEQLASLCFALQSTVGQRGRLSEADERSLFELASALWSASLQALSAPGDMSAALENLGNELFALVDGDSDNTQDCARYVAFFSGLASSWQAAGQRERAKWCLERAMRYSQQLEAQVASEEMSLERKEPLVVALFNLYMEGAKSAADSKQQALANNLLGRAVQLSRHAALGPNATVCCALAVAELQLQQAKAMLAKGGTMCSLAVALLSTSYQQLTGADLEAAALASSAARSAGLLDAKKQVLLQLCRAHLASSDPKQASSVLDTLEALAPGAAASEPGAQLMFVEARVAARRLAEALRFLAELLQAADLSTPAGQQAQATFLAGLQLAVPHASDSTLPSFQSAVSSYCWKATAAASPTALLSLVQTLLAPGHVSPVGGDDATARGAGIGGSSLAGPLAHRLALQALGSDDVAAVLHRDAGALAKVHDVLWHSAAHCLEAGSPAAARELFAAALQFCQPSARAKNARALAACHSRMGMHQRAVEYLELAARHEQQPGSLTQLLRLHELVHTGDAAQAVATIRRLASGCADFHPSLLPSICQAAAKAQHPAVGKEAFDAAVQVVIKADATASKLPAGQEAALLRLYVQAIAACLDAAQPVAQAGAAASGDSGHGALYSELIAALKLVAKRLRLLGWAKFVGPDGQGGANVEAVCCLAYNQLLAAQQGGAHEHVVALATALWQLLPLADQHLRAAVTGAAQQARILLLATQALLDLHSKQPDSGPKLALAVKLQAKLSQHMGGLPALQAENAHLHLLHQLQCLETAARQEDGAALLQSLSKLQPQAAALGGPQRSAILGMVSPQHSKVVQEAAAALLLDSIAAEGSVEALALVPALLSQLTLSEEQQLRLLSRCHGLLAGLPVDQRSPGWAQCGQWLAAHAWNSGCRLAQSATGDEQSAALMTVAVQLLETCGPAGSDQLRRMKAALDAAAVTAGSMGQQSGGGATAQANQQGQQASMHAESSATVTADGAPSDAAEEAGDEQPVWGVRKPAGSEAVAAPAGKIDGADARSSGIAIPSFRDVKQAERQQAAPINLFRPSGGAAAAASAAAQQAAVRPNGPVNPLAFLDGAPALGAPAAAATHYKEPAAAAGPPAVGGAATAAHVPHQPAPAGRAAPKPAAAVHRAGPSGLAAAAAAALASAAEDSMSEDEGETEQGAGWLGAVMAAQQRVMGSAPTKRHGRAGPAGRTAPAVRQPAAAPKAATAVAKAATVKRQAAADLAEDDGPEALSLGDSEQPARHGMLGFMGL